MTAARRAPPGAAILCAAACALGCSRELADERPPDEPRAAPADDFGRSVLPLAELGLREAWQHNTEPTLTWPFQARADRVLSEAKLRLRIADELEDRWHIRALEVLVNQERVASLPIESLKRDARDRVIPIDAQLLGGKNSLTLKLLLERDGPCGTIPQGAWRAVAGGELLLTSSPLPLPNELSLLPLPLVDRATDRAASVPFALPANASLETLRAAGSVASWLGVQVGAALSFPAAAALPDASAVVFVDSPEAAGAQGLPAPEGPAASIVDHPLHPNGNVKLLVLSGRTPAELAVAAAAFTAPGARLEGARVAFQPPPPHEPLAPYASPRWMPARNVLRLDHVAGFETLAHEGRSGGKMALRFRIPPDLWVWPVESVLLDLGYSVTVPQGAAQPRLDVLFNGGFLGTLQPLDASRGQTVGHSRLRVHRSRLHGFNELAVFVSWPEADELACASSQSPTFRVAITPDSSLHLEGLTHFANLPDVSLFVHDGYPFTRLPDLADTAVVLPDAPAPQELSLYFSTLAFFGQVTGVVAAPELLAAEAVLRASELDRDLLVIGAPDRGLLLRRWADKLPLAIGADAVAPQMPDAGRGLLGLLDGGLGYRELSRARETVAGLARLTAVMGMRSPLAHRRSAVFLTATSAADFAPLAELQGYADATTAGGDLLVAGSGRRYRYRIGPAYTLGRLPAFDAIRWFFASHVVALIAAAALGTLVLAAELQRGLVAHIARRLREGAPEVR